MEDVLDLYEEPYDPTRPKVNFDETSKQLIAETRVPLPPKPGTPARYDYEYQRNGTATSLCFVSRKRAGGILLSLHSARCWTLPGKCAGWSMSGIGREGDSCRVGQPQHPQARVAL